MAAETVDITLYGSLSRLADGERRVSVEADNIGEMLERLGEAYPQLKPQLERGVSVSVDGQIYRNSWFKEIGPESEIVLLPRLAGG